MSKLTRSPAWQALAAHQRRIAAASLSELFAADASRAGRFSLEAGGLLLDYSKHRIDAETMRLLRELAAQAQVPAWIARMFAGDPVNDTEGRAALHVALRSDRRAFPERGDVMPAVRAARDQMRRFVDEAQRGALKGGDGLPITDIVNIGIGGS
ncbi:MAG TPA: glucose-6-phosphate isomerase, partial [Burkholderiales bacterium]|nr:glucose-6-phosphate isomerase [Burkholderiales bacterium]